MERLRISIGVGGRFHADRMTRALIDSGNDVTLYTTYPGSRFPNVPSSHIQSCLVAESVFRLGRIVGRENEGDLLKMKWFGKWWGKRLDTSKTDIIIGWSSFSENAFLKAPGALKVLVRDSAHILFQTEQLGREYEKRGLTFPDRRLTAEREMREYELADYILLPSEFARRTFLERGFPAEKLKTIHLGVDTSLFKAKIPDRSTGPLRVVYFGTLSLQKGIPYLFEATKNFSQSELELTVIGPVDAELKKMLADFSHVKYRAPMEHAMLSELVREQDVFVLPSLHDGFGLVVPQALASGLVAIVSDHVGAQELVKDESNGYVIPAGSSDAIREKLAFLAKNRERLVEMRRAAAESSRYADWDLYAKELSHWVASLPRKKKSITADAYTSGGKLLHLRQTKLGHLPPAASAAKSLAEAGIGQLVVEYGHPSPEWVNKSASDVPRLRYGDPYNKMLPGFTHAGARIIMAFFRLSLKFLREGKPKLIVTHGVIEQLLAYALYRVWGIPYVAYVHEVYDNTDVPGGVFAFAFWRERFTLRFARFMIFPSQGRADVYRERYGLLNSYYCVANCPRKRSPGEKVDLKKRYKLPQDSLVMGYMGGIGGANGIELAIRAMARSPKVEFILWGWGDKDYIDSLKALAESLGCSSRVHFAGQVREEKWKLLESCDVSFCVYEPKWLRFRLAALASNKFLESIALGRPVITNGFADFNSVVSKHEIGIALPELTEEAVLEAMNQLVDNLPLRSRMSENAYRLHADELNYEQQFQRCLHRFLQLTRSGGAAVSEPEFSASTGARMGK
jgi:glycosyltransferase involved in cell wall biosynthesis